MLRGKTVILGVTGSIAAYKIATLDNTGKYVSKEASQCACNHDKECNEFYQSYYL